MESKRKNGSNRSKKRSRVKQAQNLLPTKNLVGVHPAVPSALISDLDFLINDLSATTVSSIELCLRSHPVGVTPPNEAGKSFVVTGLRSWQIYQVGVARAILQPGSLTVFVHPEAVDDVTIAQLAAADSFHSAAMYSLSPASGYQQLVALQQLITDEKWQQLYDDRPRLPDRLTDKSVELPKPNSTDGVKRPRGRPRIHPISPDRPKRPRGRPRKIDPPITSSHQGSQPE